jgi:hypothetical protein
MCALRTVSPLLPMLRDANMGTRVEPPRGVNPRGGWYGRRRAVGKDTNSGVRLLCRGREQVAPDLDPMPGVTFAQVRDVARWVHYELQQAKSKHWHRPP